MSKASNWYVCHDPRDIQKMLPDFDGPLGAGPYLIIVFPDRNVFIFTREDALNMIHTFVNFMGAIISNTTIGGGE